MIIYPQLASIIIKMTWALMVDIMLHPFVGAAAPFLGAKEMKKEKNEEKLGEVKRKDGDPELRT